MEILSLTCNAIKCETNWSTFDQVKEEIDWNNKCSIFNLRWDKSVKKEKEKIYDHICFSIIEWDDD